MVRIIDLRHNTVVKLATAPVATDDIRTRDAVARSILESGPSTAAALSEKLGFTPAGIRRHLDALVADGVLEAREPHAALVRGRGRPSKVFVMTDNGREKFEHSYDDLAVAALKFMSAQVGEQSIKAFADSRADDIIKKASTSMAKRSHKSEALATFLSDQGYAASVAVKTHGEEICQHHCPIAHVAAEFPQLCEAETRAFSELLGTHVQRLATIAHGDGVCTTFIPKSATSSTTKRGRS
ncbi:COG2345 Predicted transcriptional regulator [Candidatus Nanopelagicaceae bacterium]